MKTLMNKNRQKISGIFLILSGAIFLITEFISAAAWSHPAYSYTYNFISNLGVRGPSHLFGQYMLSPLSWVMNTGFISFGILIFIGTLFLTNISRAAHWITSILGLIVAVGGVLVGYFHGLGEALIDGTGMYHSMGAFMAFIFGNILLITFGSINLPLSKRSKLILILLGIFGIIATLSYTAALILAPDNHPIIIIGLIERCAVYPILFGMIYTGYSMIKSKSISIK
ncbi:DUF998 domain-containing protein [Lentilactobacillus kosonis]|uniref:Permeases of the major facilitator superfamily n=1 Tax=Lentilactobacillus kosonis TaxID=2810561 RepID=A0A401FHV9_9LACO|nr:DUF998 domain-containing protein [Lentilactobacillus kosonis]GAY71932.1 permeases of the major facilitator superfamily [Lentilactobacillus kosonis]